MAMDVKTKQKQTKEPFFYNQEQKKKNTLAFDGQWLYLKMQLIHDNNNNNNIGNIIVNSNNNNINQSNKNITSKVFFQQLFATIFHSKHYSSCLFIYGYCDDLYEE